MTFDQCIGGLYSGNELKYLFGAYALAKSRGFFAHNKNPNPQKMIGGIADCKEDYCSEEHILGAVASLRDSADPLIRSCGDVMLREIMLESSDCTCDYGAEIARMTAYEEEITAASRERKAVSDRRYLMYRELVRTAAEAGDAPPVTVLRMLDRCAELLDMSRRDRKIQEAVAELYPAAERRLHTKEELEAVRNTLISKGLLFAVKRADGVTFSVIPSEIADVLRAHYGFELSVRGYSALFDYLYEHQKKRYFINALYDVKIEVSPKASPAQLRELTLSSVKPSFLVMGGRGLHKGLERTALSEWCADLGLVRTGGKNELTKRLFDYYNT